MSLEHIYSKLLRCMSVQIYKLNKTISGVPKNACHRLGSKLMRTRPPCPGPRPCHRSRWFVPQHVVLTREGTTARILVKKAFTENVNL